MLVPSHDLGSVCGHCDRTFLPKGPVLTPRRTDDVYAANDLEAACSGVPRHFSVGGTDLPDDGNAGPVSIVPTTNTPSLNAARKPTPASRANVRPGFFRPQVSWGSGGLGVNPPGPARPERNQTGAPTALRKVSPGSVSVQTIAIGNILTMSLSDTGQQATLSFVSPGILTLRWKERTGHFFDGVRVRSIGRRPELLRFVREAPLLASVVATAAAAHLSFHLFPLFVATSVAIGVLASFSGAVVFRRGRRFPAMPATALAV